VRLSTSATFTLEYLGVAVLPRSHTPCVKLPRPSLTSHYVKKCCLPRELLTSHPIKVSHYVKKCCLPRELLTSHPIKVSTYVTCLILNITSRPIIGGMPSRHNFRGFPNLPAAFLLLLWEQSYWHFLGPFYGGN
jgi:hypothetical protein